MRTHRLPDRVGHVIVRDERHRLGPFERRAFAVGEERRFAPDDDRREAALGFAVLARVARVHVDAVRAAVDLRGAQPHELDQRRLQPALRDPLLEREHRVERVRIRLAVVEAGLHDAFLGSG
nr:hypothetical protein DO63_5965 [Burkholderia pseudomallei]